jgi:hypothetical protein
MGPYAAVAGTWTTARRPPAALAGLHDRPRTDRTSGPGSGV